MKARRISLLIAVISLIAGISVSVSAAKTHESRLNTFERITVADPDEDVDGNLKFTVTSLPDGVTVPDGLEEYDSIVVKVSCQNDKPFPEGKSLDAAFVSYRPMGFPAQPLGKNFVLYRVEGDKLFEVPIIKASEDEVDFSLDTFGIYVLFREIDKENRLDIDYIDYLKNYKQYSFKYNSCVSVRCTVNKTDPDEYVVVPLMERAALPAGIRTPEHLEGYEKIVVSITDSEGKAFPKGKALFASIEATDSLLYHNLPLGFAFELYRVDGDTLEEVPIIASATDYVSFMLDDFGTYVLYRSIDLKKYGFDDSRHYRGNIDSDITLFFTDPDWDLAIAKITPVIAKATLPKNVKKPTALAGLKNHVFSVTSEDGSPFPEGRSFKADIDHMIAAGGPDTAPILGSSYSLYRIEDNALVAVPITYSDEERVSFDLNAFGTYALFCGIDLNRFSVEFRLSEMTTDAYYEETGLAEGTPVDFPEPPTKDGFTFLGWQVRVGSVLEYVDMSEPVKAPCILVAGWQEDGTMTPTMYELSSVRLLDGCALRFVACVNENTREKCEEYGFLVTTTKPYADKCPLVFNQNGDASGVNEYGVKYTSGVAFDKEEGIDLIYSTDGGFIGAPEVEAYFFTGLLTNIPKEHKGDMVYARPYVRVGDTYIYGSIHGSSIANTLHDIWRGGCEGMTDEQVQMIKNLLDIHDEEE